MNSTNEWAFHSNGNLVSWTNWDIDGGDGQPNNGHGCCNGEECVASWNPADFEWHDDLCTHLWPSIYLNVWYYSLDHEIKTFCI